MPAILIILIGISILPVSKARAQAAKLYTAKIDTRFAKTPDLPSILLKDALNTLSEVYHVSIIFDDALIADRKITPLNKYSRDIQQDLRTILCNEALTYTRVGRRTYVILPLSDMDDRPKKGRIRGVVLDLQGEPLPAAQVLLQGTQLGAAANDAGEYIIERVPAGEATLETRVIGYRTEKARVVVEPGGWVEQNFSLPVDPLDMNEIITTATHIPMTKIESSVAVTTVNSREIRSLAPRSTADLLKAIPGFYVESSGGEGGNNLFPRGIPQDGSYRYVAVMEDGLPVFEAPELAFANADIFLRVDETLRIVEGVRGGTGSIFASNAPGGMVNFISKTGGPERAGLVKMGIGDYGLWRTDFNYGGPLGRNWRFNIGGFLRIDNGIRNPGYIANKGGQLKANATHFFKKGFVRLYAKYLNDRNIFYLPVPLQNPENPHGIPGFDANYGTLTSLAANPGRFPTPDGRIIQRDIRDGIHPNVLSFTSEVYLDLGRNWGLKNMTRYATAQLQFNAIFSLDSPLPAREFAESVKGLLPEAGYSGWEYRFADSNMPIAHPEALNGNGLVTRAGWWSVDKPLRNFIHNLQLQRSFGEHTSTFGLYFSHYTADDFWYWHNVLMEVRDTPRLLDLVAVRQDGRHVAVTKEGIEQYGTFYTNASNRAHVLAFYLSEEWQALPRLRVNGGFRFEYGNFAGKVEDTRRDFVLPGASSLAERNVMFGAGTFRKYAFDLSAWAMSAGGNVTINRATSLYLRASRGFRMPDFEQWTFADPGDPVKVQQGRTQNVLQLEGGVKVGTEKLGLFAAFFSSKLNKIPFFDEIVQDGQIKKNIRFATSRTYGVEIETRWYPVKNLALHLTGTLQNPKIQDLVFRRYEGRKGESIQISWEGRQVRRIPRVLLDFRPVFSSKAITFYGDWQYIGRRYVDDANTMILPAYSVFNAGASYTIPSEKMTFTFAVANISNTIGLTEGNPRVDQVVANHRDIFMARPILGRSGILSLTYRF